MTMGDDSIRRLGLAGKEDKRPVTWPDVAKQALGVLALLIVAAMVVLLVKL